MQTRRPRIRKVRVPCPHCGESTVVQVYPAMWIMGRKASGRLFVATCARHCGGDVPVRGEDIREAV